MKKKAVALLLSLCLLALCGCASGTPSVPSSDLSSGSSSDSSPAPVPSVSVEDVLEDIYTNEEYTEIKKLIDSVNPDMYPYLEHPQFHKYWEDSVKLSSIGIKGLPVLFETIKEDENNKYKFFLKWYQMESLCAVLRIRPNSIYWGPNQEFTVGDDENIDGGHERASIRRYYRLLQNDLPTIISSEKTVEDKILTLREYGIFAIPYVVEEIDKGNTEYEAFFTAIGLHMDVPRYMEFMSNFELPDEERYEAEGFMDGAESFDYKVWLSENEKDLENLFKYLDAYCAEYEARQEK